MIEFTNGELQERIEKLQAHIKELVSEQKAYVRKLKGEIRMLHIRVKEANRGREECTRYIRRHLHKEQRTTSTST